MAYQRATGSEGREPARGAVTRRRFLRGVAATGAVASVAGLPARPATGETPVFSPNHRFVFFDLRDYQQQVHDRLGHTGVQALKERTLRDLR